MEERAGRSEARTWAARRRLSPTAILGIVASLVLALPTAGASQESGSVGLLGGVSQFDLSGTGTVPSVSFRGNTSLDRALLGEVAFTYLAYTSQGDRQVNHLLPELQAHLQWPREGLRPYLGVGGGLSHAWADLGGAGDASETDLTVSVAGGVRIPIGTHWVVQAELRVRSIDPWVGTTGDWGIGLAGRF